ncbi:hypothetical protein N7492_009229 [Penicillium capsulatum]|uniref:Uncharacterized protein n=1 Tax=Penicillium capsulatum TaxID=69766 RepID=A0A9W9HUY0_9EURO|nr:hypothetical protein N7492_009229 [Penicillium capsulatum]KAJ6106625.1 hypothetical protein N7512_010142 [Penicillium capsulatum]
MKYLYGTGILMGLMAIMPALATPNPAPRVPSDSMMLYNDCCGDCMTKDHACKKQPGHDELTCRRDMANCVIACSSKHLPAHGQCLGNCRVVNNNCVSQPGVDMKHCQTDLSSCLSRCQA